MPTVTVTARYLGNNNFAYQEFGDYWEDRLLTVEADTRQQYAISSNMSQHGAEQLAAKIRQDVTEHYGIKEHVSEIHNLEVNPLESLGDYRLNYVVFDNANNFTVQMMVSTPSDRSGDLPIMIIPNGTASSPLTLFGLTNRDYHNRVAHHFAEDYIVVAIYLIDSRNEDFYFANALGESAEIRPRRYCDKIQSAIDYALSLPNSDSTRIGIYGISMGGEASLISAFCDTRIDIIAASGTNVFTDSIVQLTDNRRFVYPTMYFDGVVRLPEMHEIAYTLHPRPVIMEISQEDNTGVFENAYKNTQLVEQFYAIVGGVADAHTVVIENDDEHCPSQISPGGHCMEVTGVKVIFDQYFLGE